MTTDSTIYVFHITRPDRQAVFLHPFENFEKIISKGGVIKIEGRYGSEPVIESLTSFRNTLYRIVEESVNNWIAESRFIPRFLTSAAVFMVLYFFLSFAIRDPLPMIDEIILSLAASIVVYFSLGKRYRLSGASSKLRAHYRGVVDRVVFTESSFALAVENLLKQLRGNSVETMLEILESESEDLEIIKSSSFNEERAQFFSYIEKQLKKQLSSGQKKLVSRIISSNQGVRKELLKKLDFVDITGEIDIYLLMLYLNLR